MPAGRHTINPRHERCKNAAGCSFRGHRALQCCSVRPCRPATGPLAVPDYQSSFGRVAPWHQRRCTTALSHMPAGRHTINPRHERCKNAAGRSSRGHRALQCSSVRPCRPAYSFRGHRALQCRSVRPCRPATGPLAVPVSNGGGDGGGYGVDGLERRVRPLGARPAGLALVVGRPTNK